MDTVGDLMEFLARFGRNVQIVAEVDTRLMGIAFSYDAPMGRLVLKQVPKEQSFLIRQSAQ